MQQSCYHGIGEGEKQKVKGKTIKKNRMVIFQITAWKEYKYGVFSCPYFPVFGLNTRKYGAEKLPYLDNFHAVDPMAEILFPPMKTWRIYSTKAIISEKHRAVPEGKWVPGRCIEIPCHNELFGPKIHKKLIREKMKNS